MVDKCIVSWTYIRRGMQKTKKILFWTSTNICGLGQTNNCIFWMAIRNALKTLRKNSDSIIQSFSVVIIYNVQDI